MTQEEENGRRPSRRAVLAGGTGLFLAACTPSPKTDPGASSSSGSRASGAPGTNSGGASGGAGWVRAENAKPGTPGWQIGSANQAGETDLAGYADRVSVRPGENVSLHISSTLGPVTVRAFRLGNYRGVGARQVWASAPVPVSRQAAPVVDSLRTVRCRWPASLHVSTTGWPEGCYLFRLEAGGRARFVPLTVRSSTTAGRLVVVSAVLTHQAYNAWGGYSLYKGPDGSFGTRAHAVSFDRPYDGNGAPKMLQYEQSAILVAEGLDVDLAYVTAWDLNHEPGLLAGARGVVSLGHDEYWTVPMRRHVEAARDAGTNVAFLGANAVYWRVRLDESARLVTCYKSSALDPNHGSPDTTAQWRQRPHPDPENSLTGMLYEAFPAQADLVVHDPSFFLFSGTGARAGDIYGGLVAGEIDRAYPIAGTPSGLQVVAHTPVPQAQKPDTHSDMTYYTAPSGAGVFAAGTMAWVLGLRGPGAHKGIDQRASTFARTVTANLFREMAAGPMGRSHPARPNLASIGASVHTSTGSGGPVALA